MTEPKDAFDLFWEWANKPLDSDLSLSSEIYNPVMALPEEEWKDRDKVNEAVRAARGGLNDKARL